MSSSSLRPLLSHRHSFVPTSEQRKVFMLPTSLLRFSVRSVVADASSLAPVPEPLGVRSGLSITASERFFMLSIVDPPHNIGKLNRAKKLQRSESCCRMSRAAGSGFLGSAGFAAFFGPAFFYCLVGAAQSQRIGRNILRDA